MFIHVGNDNVIHSKDIIAIIDYQMILSSSITGEMIEKSIEQDKGIGPKSEAKSVVITTRNVYFSTLSIHTLKKRASMISTISKLDDYAEEFG